MEVEKCKIFGVKLLQQIFSLVIKVDDHNFVW